MDPNPYAAPQLSKADKPRRFSWFGPLFFLYVLMAIAAYGYADYRTANTRYNDPVGSAVLWSGMIGGVGVYFALKRLFPVRP